MEANKIFFKKSGKKIQISNVIKKASGWQEIYRKFQKNINQLCRIQVQ